jgi:hypothetical protein
LRGRVVCYRNDLGTISRGAVFSRLALGGSRSNPRSSCLRTRNSTGPNCEAQNGRPTIGESFSKTFSRWVSNGSCQPCMSYLHLLGNLRILELKNGHEPPDSDLRLQRLHYSPTTRAQRHHCTVDISVQQI